MSLTSHLSEGSVERRFKAFLDGFDSPAIPNPIHSTEVAKSFGYRGPLVGGVTVWGWCARPIMEALGDRWLDEGWAEVNFRQPVFPDDQLVIRVGAGAGSRPLEVVNQDNEVCIRATVGLGQHPGFTNYRRSARLVAEPPLAELPELTLESAPVGQDLRPMSLTYGLLEAALYASDKQRDSKEPWVGYGSHIHPGWIAARMTPLLKHSFHYGPSIHSQTLLQNVAPALTGQDVTVAGTLIEVFERKGHHYAVLDGLLLSEAGEELARLRHTTIFRIRPVGSS